MLSIHSHRNPKEIGTKDWCTAMIGKTMLFLKGIWTLKVWITKADECFKCYLMGHHSKNMEESGVECEMNCGCWVKSF